MAAISSVIGTSIYQRETRVNTMKGIEIPKGDCEMRRFARLVSMLGLVPPCLSIDGMATSVMSRSIALDASMLGSTTAGRVGRQSGAGRAGPSDTLLPVCLPSFESLTDHNDD